MDDQHGSDDSPLISEMDPIRFRLGWAALVMFGATRVNKTTRTKPLKPGGGKGRGKHSAGPWAHPVENRKR